MHPYHAQHLAQARIDDLLRYRQAHLPRRERQTPPLRQRLRLLLRSWLVKHTAAGSGEAGTGSHPTTAARPSTPATCRPAP